MASPITITLDELKTLQAWNERLLKKGLAVPELQPSIDDAMQMDRIIAYIRAGAPDLASTVPSLASLEAADSQRSVRQILGSNFVGLEIARRVYKHVLTDEHVRALQEIRLFDESNQEFRSQDDTMDILRQVAANNRKQFLFPLVPVSVPELHALDPDRFDNDRNAPWFSEKQEREKWSDKRPERARWCLMDTDIFPGSLSKNVHAQKKHVPATCPGYRLSLPWEYVPGALLYQTATKQKIGGSKWVRFFVQTADGYWVLANWCGERLHVNVESANAYVGVGSCSLRAS